MEFKSTEDLLKSVEEVDERNPVEGRVVYVKPKHDHSFDLSSSSSGAHPRAKTDRKTGKTVVESAVEIHAPPSPPNFPLPDLNTNSVPVKKILNTETKKAKDDENEIIQMSTFSPPKSVQESKTFNIEEISEISSLSPEDGNKVPTVPQPGPSRIPVPAKERPKSNLEKEIEAKIKSGQTKATDKKVAVIGEEKDPFTVTSAGRWALDFDQTRTQRNEEIKNLDIEAKTSEHEKANDESLNESVQKNFNPVPRSSFEIQHEKIKATTSYRPKTARASRSREKKLRKKVSVGKVVKPSKSESKQTLVQTKTSESSSSKCSEEEREVNVETQTRSKSSSSSTSSSVSTPPRTKSKKKRVSQQKHRKPTQKASAEESESVSSVTFSKTTMSEVKNEQNLKPEVEKKVKVNKVLGVYIHHTSELKFDIKIRDPNVRVSLVDSTTGQLAVFRHKTIKKRQLEQPFIVPQTTKSCKFTSRM